MSSALAVQLCRIVAPEKLPDRFLASGIFTHNDDHLLQDQVILAYVFEINRPMFASSNVLTGLLQTLETEHAKLNLKTNLDDQFELVLRQVNQQLNAISQSGETDWIGNFNGLIMVMTGDELHFAQTGRCPAYLLQNNRIRQITDDPQPDHEPHPLKTFSNLASGHLQEGDHLLIANQELYNEISLDALRRIINTGSPYQSSQAIAKQLKKEKNPAVSSLILAVGTDTTEEPTEVLLEEEMQSGIMKIRKQLAPLASAAKQLSQKAGEVGMATAKQTGTLMKEKVAPKAGEILHKGAEKAKTLTDQVKTKLEEPAPAAAPANRPVVEIIVSQHQREEAEQERIAREAEERLENQYEEPDSIIPVSELALDSSAPVVSTEDHSVNLPAILEFMKQLVLVTVPRLILNGLRFALRWLSVHRNKKIAALVLAVVLVGSTLLGVLTKRHPQATVNSSVANDQILTDVKDLDAKITTAVSLKQDIEAGKEIESAQKKLLSLKDPSSGQQKQADQLWDSIATKADSLDKTVRLNKAVATYSFASEADGFLSQLPYFYGWNTDNAALIRTGQGDPSQVNATFPLNSSTDGIVSVAHSTENDSVSYALTRQNKVYRILQDGNDTSLHTVTTSSGDFDIGDAIGSYAGNVYILDGKTGLLWRYINNGDGTYNNRESVIDGSKYDIRKSVSLAIDGSIYILKQDGTLLKFDRGVQNADFALKDQPYLDRSMIQPVQVITDDTTPSIYILDAGTTTATRSTAKVLEFNKTGSFIREYAFPKDFTNVKAFDINAKEKKMWVLNGASVQEFDL